METKDLDTFPFELNVLYRSYDYITYQKKLKHFPATLKNLVLQWYMGIRGDNIAPWTQMKKEFLDKYQEYYRDKDRKEAIFRMT